MNLLTSLFLGFAIFTAANAIPVAAPAPEPKLQGKALEDALRYLNAPEPWESSDVPPEIMHRLYS